MFTPLNKDEIMRIVRLQISQVQKMLSENGVTLHVSDSAIEKLCNDGYDPEFGARPVKRTIQRMVLNQLSKDILAQKIDKSNTIHINCIDDELVFENK